MMAERSVLYVNGDAQNSIAMIRPVLPNFSFRLKLALSFLWRTNWDHLDNSSNRHAYKTNEDASDPLVECEGCGVCEIAKELYYDELEDDGAAEDHDEHVIV